MDRAVLILTTSKPCRFAADGAAGPGRRGKCGDGECSAVENKAVCKTDCAP